MISKEEEALLQSKIEDINWQYDTIYTIDSFMKMTALMNNKDKTEVMYNDITYEIDEVKERLKSISEKF